MKKLPISEFRSLGLLQEINRRLLHPAGLALAITFDKLDRGSSFEVEILDARDDPDGFAFTFGDGGVDPEVAARKARQVDALLVERIHRRIAEFGANIQPVPGHTDARPVSLAADDLTVETVSRIITDALVAAGYDDPLFCGEAADLHNAIALRIIGPLVASLRLLNGCTLAVVPSTPVEAHAAAPASITATEAARARWLSRELVRLAADHDVHGGVDSNGALLTRTAPTELLGLEVEEARALAAAVASWPLNEPPADARKTFERMEELFALAQPGMAFWRGQRQDLLNSADIIHAKMTEYRASRSEIERFLAGDLGIAELTDPAAVRRELEARVAPLQATIDALDAERRGAAGALAPISAALGRLDTLKFYNDTLDRVAGFDGPITAGKWP